MSKCTHSALKQINGMACPLCQLDDILQLNATETQKKEKIMSLISDMNHNIYFYKKEYNIFNNKYKKLYERMQKTTLHTRNEIAKRLNTPIKDALEICLKTHFYNHERFIRYVKKYSRVSSNVVNKPPSKIHYWTVRVFKKTIITMLDSYRPEHSDEIKKLRDDHIEEFKDNTQNKIDKMVRAIEKKAVAIYEREMEKHGQNVRKTNRIIGFILFSTGIVLLLGIPIFSILAQKNTKLPIETHYFSFVGMTLVFWGIQQIRYDPYNRTPNHSTQPDMNFFQRITDTLFRRHSFDQSDNPQKPSKTK